MHSKKNSTKLPSPTMVKSHISTVFDVSKSREFSVAVPIKFEPYSITKTALFDKGCLTCGKNNIVVEYYGERHVCLRCRNFLKTINDDKASVYLNDNGDVEVVGEKNEAGGKSTFYFIDIDKLWFKDYRCYATLAQENELIVLLHDDQSLKKNRGKKETKSILKEKI